MRKILIIVGALMVLAGVFWPWLSRFSVGRLPGDIIIERPGLKVFFPITTMVILSVVISLILWLLRR